MKTVVSLMIDAHRLPGGLPGFFEATGCTLVDVNELQEYTMYDEPKVTAWITLEHNDPRIAKIRDYIMKHDGTDPALGCYNEFTEEERQSAPLLLMRSEANEIAPAGALWGTKYDSTNACPACGSGTRQSSPLYVDYQQKQTIRNHRAIGNYDGHLLVDLGIKKKLIDEGITGIKFGDTYLRLKNGKRSLLARDQVLVTHTLPPQSPKTNLDRTKCCPQCHRGGWYDQPEGPRLTYYRREDLRDICDFNESWEWWGSRKYDPQSHLVKVPRPSTLVTPKVMNLLREHGVTTFQWEPVFVDE